MPGVLQIWIIVGQGPYIYTVLAGCACEHYLDIFSCLFEVFCISCSLLLGDVSIWTVKMVCDSSLKDTSSTTTIFNSDHIGRPGCSVG